MKHFTKLFLFLLLLFSITANAQVSTNFSNKTPIDLKGKFGKSYKLKIDFEIPAKNIDELLKAEKGQTDTVRGPQPFQIAVPVPVDLDIAKRAQKSP